MTVFGNKRILLFSPYGCTKHYGVAIKEELEKRGAHVDEYDERPSEEAYMKIIIRLLKKKVPQIFLRYIQNVIKENKTKDYDYILICRGEAFTPVAIDSLRKAYPRVKVILYLWDVMRNCAMDDVLASCNKVMSFDPENAKKYNVGFRPTFFVNDYLQVNESVEFDYDLEFICTLYHPRHKMVKQLRKNFESQGLRFYTYLYVPGLIRYIQESLFHFPFYSFKEINLKPISIPETVEVLNKTKCILDVNPPYQVSLSTRAHEAIAARRKYITTNKHIMDYEYYDPNNILIIDIDNPVISKEFVQTPFNPVSEEVLYKYSVAGLVDDLFNNM